MTEEILQNNVLENVEEKKEYEIVGVTFNNSKVYYFDPQGIKYTKNQYVILDTVRGLEYGVIAQENRIVSASNLVLPLRSVIRAATEEDTQKHLANIEKEKEAYNLCLERIEFHKLDMKLIDASYTFDNSKLIFNFTADNRVDFRELVKDLAAIFKTRIELRQISIRDEAKIIGGLGLCGRPFCCKTFLNDYGQVSLKMAKEQNVSTNSQKNSGACGRLMCCLRFEYELYEEELKKLPKNGTLVNTPDGSGKVVDLNPLCGLIKVKLDESENVKFFPREDVKIIENE